MKRLAVVGAVALVLFALPSAHAADKGEAHSTVVRFADLDLNQAAGLRELYARIRRAARMVCSRRDPSYSDSLTVFKTAQAEYRTCVKRAIDAAVRQVRGSIRHRNS